MSDYSIRYNRMSPKGIYIRMYVYVAPTRFLVDWIHTIQKWQYM